MSFMLLTEPVFYRIQGGIVHIETGSGHDPVNLGIPIAEFRKALATGVRALAEFDATHEVVALQTARG